MPIDTTDVASQVAEFYFEAEREIVENIGKRLKAGVPVGDWQKQALRSQQLLSKASQETMAALGKPDAWVAEVGRAYLASPEVANLAVTASIVGKIPSTQQVAAVSHVATELANTLDAVNRTVLRRVDDVYAQVVGKAVGVTAAGGSFKTIEQSAQQAMDEFAKRGVGTFVDRSGRNWRLGDYTDMATRTGLSNAQRRGHEAALGDTDLELVVVQPGPRPCPICDKWARKVLTLGHQGGVVMEVTAYGPTPTRKVRVDGTLNEARSAGFEHPNCRCALRAFIPGVTKKSAIERPPFDASEYAATQTQRGLERDLRAARLDLARAIDPRAAVVAKRKVKAARNKVADHATAKGLLRQHDRESIRGRFRPAGVARPPAKPDVPVPSLADVQAKAMAGATADAQALSVRWFDDAVANGAEPRTALGSALDAVTAKTPKGTTKPAPVSALNGHGDVDLQTRFKSGGVSNVEIITGDTASGGVYKATLADGTPVVMKRTGGLARYDPTMTAAREAAHENLFSYFARRSGLNAPAVMDTEFTMTATGATKSATWSVAEFKVGVRPSVTVKGHDLLRDKDSGYAEMGWLDTLFGNSDRHRGNFMLDDAQHVIPIDHGYLNLTKRGVPLGSQDTATVGAFPEDWYDRWPAFREQIVADVEANQQMFKDAGYDDFASPGGVFQERLKLLDDQAAEGKRMADLKAQLAASRKAKGIIDD